MRFFGIENIEEIDFGKLTRQLPGRQAWNPLSTQGAYILAILQSYSTLQECEINNAHRLAHFLGQGIVETNYLRARAEDLRYGFDALKGKWSHKFANDEEIAAFAGKPERIANRIYGGRTDLGNGPEDSGDGWRYRGRGFFQITGRDNYRRYGEMAGIDLIGAPESLERDLKLSVKVAAAYFQKTGLGEFADRNDISAVSRGVNRGNPRAGRPAYHEAERIDWTTKALALVRDPQSLLAPSTDELRIGATGEPVKTLQRWLVALGYNIGAVDGVFGPATRRAIVAFQEENSLTVTGVVDAATKTALQNELGVMQHPVDLPPSQPAPPPPVAAEPPPAPPVVAEPPPVAAEPPPETPAPEPPPVAAEAAPDQSRAPTPAPTQTAEAPTEAPPSPVTNGASPAPDSPPAETAPTEPAPAPSTQPPSGASSQPTSGAPPAA